MFFYSQPANFCGLLIISINMTQHDPGPKSDLHSQVAIKPALNKYMLYDRTLQVDLIEILNCFTLFG